MALGTNRTRNWGKDAQQVALFLVLDRNHVAYRVTPVKLPVGHQEKGKRLALWLTPSRNGVTLPYYQGTCAELVNVRRGRWHARHPFDGRVIAEGVSLRDVVRTAILAVWH